MNFTSTPLSPTKGRSLKRSDVHVADEGLDVAIEKRFGLKSQRNLSTHSRLLSNDLYTSSQPEFLVESYLLDGKEDDEDKGRDGGGGNLKTLMRRGQLGSQLPEQGRRVQVCRGKAPLRQ